MAEGLSPVCVDWLTRSGLTVDVVGSRVRLLEYGAQPLSSFDTAADPIVVLTHGERNRETWPQVAAPALLDVERWLIKGSASDVRSRAGLEGRGGPSAATVADGFVLEVDGRDVVVIDPDGVARMRFFRRDPTWAAPRIFTQLADLSLEDLVARLGSESGW